VQSREDQGRGKSEREKKGKKLARDLRRSPVVKNKEVCSTTKREQIQNTKGGK